MILPGTAAPEINLPDLDGAPFELRKALQRGPVLLAFFKVSCPTCQMTFPFLERLANAQANGAQSNGAQLIAISQDNAEDSREFQQRLGVTMRTLTDAKPGYQASNAYGISSVPSLFLVESDGTVSVAADGFHKAALEEMSKPFDIALFSEIERVPAFRPG
jgi:peroxiredoxin